MYELLSKINLIMPAFYNGAILRNAYLVFEIDLCFSDSEIVRSHIVT